MKIKNFKYKNIGIYIKNIIFVFFKNINQDVSERNVKKINKIMRSVNKSNIASKLKKINDLFKKFESDPFISKEVALYEIDMGKNPEDGFKKIKKAFNQRFKKIRKSAQAKEKRDDIVKWVITNTDDDRTTDENFKD